MSNSYTFTVEDIIKASKEKEQSTASVTATPAAQTTSAVTVADSSKQSLLDTLTEIEKKYGYTGSGSSEALGLEKIEYNAPSDEDIKTQAEAELTGQKISGANSINDNTAKKIEDYAEYKESEQKSAEELIGSLEAQYAERKTAAEKEALKRGLARSSIIMNRIEEFDQGKIDSAAKIQNDLAEKLNKIDFNIAGLETAREKALAEFDIQYAADLTKKIKEFEKERQSNINETLKYNNTVTEKEAKFAADNAAAEQKSLQDYLKNKNSYDKLILDEKLATVKTYYDAMPAQDALNDFLKDSTMQRALKDYYDYMLLYLKVRASR